MLYIFLIIDIRLNVCRVKKPAGLAPGTSTSEEVCPWEIAGPPTPPQSSALDRKNSNNVDSETSSPDVSVGVVEVRGKVRSSKNNANLKHLFEKILF